MPSERAPSVSFSEAEWARMGALRRAFLRSHGVIPHDAPVLTDDEIVGSDPPPRCMRTGNAEPPHAAALQGGYCSWHPAIV